jgi:DNA-binding Lrp family transcriptional regulator
MIKLDLKDRKILYELDLDARQPLTQIGKKVGLSKDVVSYRMKKLQDEGIIKNYYTVIDAYKLGYTLFRYYINFQYVKPDLRKEIIDYFVNYKNICTVGSVVGKYDLMVVVWVKNINEFYNFWKTALDNYGDHFESRIFSVYIHGVGFQKSFLLHDHFRENERIDHEYFGEGKHVEIDELDYHLINELALNARAPLVELAKKFNTSSQTINYRIRKLKESGIIQAFRVALDLSMLGFRHYKVDIYLKEHKQRDNIINYIKKSPFVLYISTSTGLCDLELELVVENTDKLVEIIESINVNFPNAIKSYVFYGNIKIFKETFLPKIYD